MSKEEKRAQMLSMIADWQQSGMSKKRYCAENGVNEAGFYYWFSRCKENGTASGGFIVELQLKMRDFFYAASFSLFSSISSICLGVLYPNAECVLLVL